MFKPNKLKFLAILLVTLFSFSFNSAVLADEVVAKLPGYEADLSQTSVSGQPSSADFGTDLWSIKSACYSIKWQVY